MNAFLTMGGAKRPETSTPLPAGQHHVRLASIKFVEKVAKIVAEFETPDGGQFYTEWLGMDTDGQVGRLQAFVGRLYTLAGSRAPGVFQTAKDFDAAVAGLVGTEFQIVLADDTFNGNVKQVIAGKLDESLLPLSAPRPVTAPKLF